MSIQRCPNEILDMVFHFLPFQSPDKAPTVVLSAMRTCSRFRAIAERHLIRVVYLRTAKKVTLFASYLTQLVDTGAYGKVQLPIEHMAVFGRYQIPFCKPEKAAEYILPFIISTAAPTLHSLVIFGFNSQWMPEEVDGYYLKNVVQPSVRFPNLQELVLLEQHIISLDREPEQEPLQYCYPQLTSLYTHNGPIESNIFALRALRRLRLDMLERYIRGFCPPSPPVSHIETIIIDVAPHLKTGARSIVRYLDRYDRMIRGYQTFIDSNSNSPESCIVVAKSPKNCRVHVGPVLRAWKDIVQGGPGYWKKEWKPIA